MKKFIKKISLFLIVLIGILTLSLFFISNPELDGSSYFSILDKHKILQKPNLNRVIFAGGSNLSHGFDSRSVSQNLGRPVVNFGLHAGYGLKFILNDLFPYIKKGDMIVISPEYAHFYGNHALGKTDLLQVIFDICPDTKKHINFKQWLTLLQYMPQYSATKIYNRFFAFFSHKKNDFPVPYRRSSYNEFGDATAHWHLQSPGVVPYKKLKDSFNNDIILFLKDFVAKSKNKGADVVFIFPTYQKSSYLIAEGQPEEVFKKVKNIGCEVLGKPKDFVFSDSFFYDSPYHLTKKGIDKRTKLLSDFLINYLKK